MIVVGAWIEQVFWDSSSEIGQYVHIEFKYLTELLEERTRGCSAPVMFNVIEVLRRDRATVLLLELCGKLLLGQSCTFSRLSDRASADRDAM